MKELAIVILAAGNSSRLGQPKQLVNIDNNPLIYRQCQLALAVVENTSNDVYCVLGFQADEHQAAIASLNIKVLCNEQWQQGLGKSIAYATEQLQSHYQKVLFFLADQWQLTEHNLRCVVDASKYVQNKIIAAQGDTDKQLGPPVVFPQKYFEQLKGLSQKQGAKSILDKHIDSVRTIKMASAFVDLDTMEDLDKLRKLFPS